MKRLVVAICLALIGCGAIGLAANPAFAARLCVGSDHGCFSTIQAAVDAAHDGDTIHIGPGTFTGGITIDVSVKLIGAGARSTIISGGGPVLTIGEFLAPTEPTVGISRVTIRDGVTTSGPFPDAQHEIALGGGVEIPPSAGFTTGATVTIADTVITRNRVAPSGSALVGQFANGGGIDNWGTTTLNHTTVSDNLAGSTPSFPSLASDADGGGIMQFFTGTLTLNNSVVSGNRASVTAPNGRIGDTGGIFAFGGTLNINGSIVKNNTVELSTSLPSDVFAAAMAGGIHVDGSASATIRDTTITGNTVTATNAVGDAIAFCGGICADGSLVLRDSIVSDNRVRATIPTASPGSSSVDTGGLGIGDASTTTVSNTRFTGNSVSATAPAGMAMATAGAIGTATTQLTTISDSLVSGNRVTATTTTGSATVQGGGILNGGLLKLRNTTVTDNTGTASGPSGLAQGGGIWNGIFPGSPLIPELTLLDSEITHNRLEASPGIAVQGGGLFTTVPVTLKDSVIARNSPDQCYGC